MRPRHYENTSSSLARLDKLPAFALATGHLHLKLLIIRAVTDWLDWLPEKTRRDWLGLRSIVRVESHATLGGGKVRGETRYYLSSLAPNAQQHLELTRAHWSIENSCHWVLDVVFREDQCRARSGDAAQNLSTLRRISLNLLKTETSKPKEPIRGKRIYAALDPTYLENILGLPQV